MNDTQHTVPNPAPLTGMDELWCLAWTLQGVNRTLDLDTPYDTDTRFERDRLSGLRTAGHLLASRMLAAVDPFNEALTVDHDAALARIAAEAGETPTEAAARLLCEALDADTARRAAEQAAEQARSERIRAAKAAA
jgi:hypothetical protein